MTDSNDRSFSRIHNDTLVPDTGRNCITKKPSHSMYTMDSKFETLRLYHYTRIKRVRDTGDLLRPVYCSAFSKQYRQAGRYLFHCKAELMSMLN